MEGGLLKKTLGCHFCPLEFASQQSRANHHKLKHQKEHKRLKGHRKVPDYPCKFCHIGFGSRKSKWNHE